MSGQSSQPQPTPEWEHPTQWGGPTDRGGTGADSTDTESPAVTTTAMSANSASTTAEQELDHPTDTIVLEDIRTASAEAIDASSTDPSGDLDVRLYLVGIARWSRLGEDSQYTGIYATRDGSLMTTTEGVEAHSITRLRDLLTPTSDILGQERQSALAGIVADAHEDPDNE